MKPVDSWLPLAPAALHLLLALAGGERHGYGIMMEIARQSAGRYKLGPGTLYDNIGGLLDQGLLEECQCSRAIVDPRRRYYRLSHLGKGVLKAEVDRMAEVVKEVRMQLARVGGSQ